MTARAFLKINCVSSTFLKEPLLADDNHALPYYPTFGVYQLPRRTGESMAHIKYQFRYRRIYNNCLVSIPLISRTTTHNYCKNNINSFGILPQFLFIYTNKSTLFEYPKNVEIFYTNHIYHLLPSGHTMSKILFYWTRPTDLTGYHLGTENLVKKTPGHTY